MKIVVASIVTVLLLASCASDEPSPPTDALPRSTPTLDQIDLPKANTLFFLGDELLYTTNTETKKTKLIDDLGTSDVAIAADGLSYAYAKAAAEPTVVVAEVGSKETVEVPGSSPSFSPDGQFLAVTVSDPEYLICDTSATQKKKSSQAKGCDSASRVWVHRTSDLQARPELAVGAGLWDIVGWSGDSVVAYSSEEGALAAGIPGQADEAVQATLPNATALSVAPDALSVLAVQGQLTSIGDPTESLQPVSVGGTVDATAWAPAGSLALIATTEDQGRSLQLLDIETGGVTAVPGSEGMVGPAVWSKSGETFAFVVGRKKELNAMLCDTELDCTNLFASDGAIDLLYLEN